MSDGELIQLNKPAVIFHGPGGGSKFGIHLTKTVGEMVKFEQIRDQYFICVEASDWDNWDWDFRLDRQVRSIKGRVWINAGMISHLYYIDEMNIKMVEGEKEDV